jgi:hypothetical protein
MKLGVTEADELCAKLITLVPPAEAAPLLWSSAPLAAEQERPLVVAAIAESPRRFPSPWHADPMPGGYVIRDANGEALAYLYGRETEADARQAKVLTKDEARRIAVYIARLPELLGKAERD